MISNRIYQNQMPIAETIDRVGITDAEALLIAGYCEQVKSSARERANYRRVRVGLYAGRAVPDTDVIRITQVSSGLYEEGVSDDFCIAFDLFQGTDPTPTWTSTSAGLEIAKLSSRAWTYESSLGSVRELRVDGFSMETNHRIEFPAWRDCLLVSTVPAQVLASNPIPLLELDRGY